MSDARRRREEDYRHGRYRSRSRSRSPQRRDDRREERHGMYDNRRYERFDDRPRKYDRRGDRPSRDINDDRRGRRYDGNERWVSDSHQPASTSSPSEPRSKSPSRRENRKYEQNGRQETKSKNESAEPQESSEHIASEDMMAQMMGFSGFGTTKNKKVNAGATSGIAKTKAAQYRQYMNRVGGFNRELSPPPEDKK